MLFDRAMVRGAMFASWSALNEVATVCSALAAMN